MVAVTGEGRVLSPVLLHDEEVTNYPQKDKAERYYKPRDFEPGQPRQYAAETGFSRLPEVCTAQSKDDLWL